MGRPPKQIQAKGEEAPPQIYAETPPPRYAQHGHDFTLQAVMELQKSVGELGVKIDRLMSDQKSHGDKLDKVRQWVAAVTGGITVIVFLTATLVGVGRYLQMPASPAPQPPAISAPAK